jgi:hypothetical protein
MGTVTPELIHSEAAALRDVELEESRSIELAREMNRLNAAAREMRARLDFNAEPAHFEALLERAEPSGENRR